MNLIDAISATGWALRERTLCDLVALAERHAAGEKISDEEKNRIVAQRDQLFRDRMAAYENARLPWRTLLAVVDRGQNRAGLEESPLAPASVVEASDAGQTPPYFLVEDVAVVPISGVLAKHSSMVNGMSQPVGMAYSQIARAVALADRDARTRSILLDIHSPGGMVHGIQDATSEIERVAKNKRVVAYAHDLAASGAYWLASAATEIVLSPTADVGSIGVYCVVDDTSKQMQDRKVVRHVVRAGRYKGVGMQGTPVGSEDLAMMQAEVDALATEFVSTVSLNRGMSAAKAKELADGRVWIGAEAVKLGLADDVVTPRGAIEAARRAGTNRVTKQGKAIMWNELTDKEISSAPADVVAKIAGAHGYAKTPSAPAAATFDELNAAFPDDPAHVVASLKGKQTMADAQAAFSKAQGEKLTAANAKIGEQQAKITALETQVTQLQNAQSGPSNGGKQPKAPGLVPVSTGNGGGGDAGGGADGYAAAVRAHMSQHGCDKNTAMAAVAKDPKQRALHQAWCDAGHPSF